MGKPLALAWRVDGRGARDHGGYVALRQCRIDASDAIGPVGGHGSRTAAQRDLQRIKPFGHAGKVTLLPRHDLDIHDHPGAIIDRRMLLVGGQKLLTRRVCGPRGIGVGHAELLEFARRPRQPVVLIQIGQIDRIQMLGHQRPKADIGADQGGVHVHHVTRDDPRAQTVPHQPCEDRPEPLGTPPLPDPGSARNDPAAPRTCRNRRTNGSPD